MITGRRSPDAAQRDRTRGRHHPVNARLCRQERASGRQARQTGPNQFRNWLGRGQQKEEGFRLESKTCAPENSQELMTAADRLPLNPFHPGSSAWPDAQLPRERLLLLLK